MTNQEATAAVELAACPNHRREPTEQELEQEAIDLALCDCQLWGNLPESVRAWYREEAREEWTD